METCRPLVDAYLLTLLRHRTLSRRDFAETGRGECASAQACLASRQHTLQLADLHRSRGRARGSGVRGQRIDATRRTYIAEWCQSADLLARSGRAPDESHGGAPAACRGCGSELPSRSRRFCDRCRRASAERAGHSGRAAAATAFERLRADGRDPAHRALRLNDAAQRTRCINANSPHGSRPRAERTIPKSSRATSCRGCATGQSASW
jgi:hypothetical protein